MTDANGYLSKDRPHINKGQRERRARLVRIDYMPSRDALAVFNAKRSQSPRYGVDSTNSAILDAIVTEWADLTGIKYEEVTKPKSPVRRPELSDAYARANESGAMLAWLMRPKESAPVTCGARTQSGRPCRAKSLPGKRRCKWHGGCSTGPKTAEGKAKALANLRQFRAENLNADGDKD